MGEFSLLVKLHQYGSDSAGCAAGLFCPIESVFIVFFSGQDFYLSDSIFLALVYSFLFCWLLAIWVEVLGYMNTLYIVS